MNVERAVRELLQDYVSTFRIVLLNGPRQAGKTTLLQQHQERFGGEFRSLDDPATLRSAIEDPMSFVLEGDKPLHIDEVQRGSDALIRSLKVAVDRDQTKGQFVLSGSARFLTIPTLSESLAGRVGLLDLWPLSMSERAGNPTNFIDTAFTSPEKLRGKTSQWSRTQFIQAITDGGYPEAINISQLKRRAGWYDSYLATVIQRDLTEFAQVHHTQALPRLLSLIAARLGSTLVQADLAQGLGSLAAETVRNYLSYLEIVFLLGYAPAWSTNLTAKIAKTPKAYLTDSGLAAHLLRVTPEALKRPGHPALGGLTETFVFTELTKMATVAETPVTISHLRDRDGREIDFILESRDGQVVAIEVKASMSPGSDAFKHLAWLRDKLGDRFVTGIVLHFGEHTLPFGEKLFATPLSALWNHRPQRENVFRPEREPQHPG